jgi:hypothetical protein
MHPRSCSVGSAAYIVAGADPPSPSLLQWIRGDALPHPDGNAAKPPLFEPTGARHGIPSRTTAGTAAMRPAPSTQVERRCTMNQVYVAVWDGAHYLVVRKRVLNSWWGSNSVVVLSAEAMAAVLAIRNASGGGTEQDWDLVKKLLSGAWRAAGQSPTAANARCPAPWTHWTGRLKAPNARIRKPMTSPWRRWPLCRACSARTQEPLPRSALRVHLAGALHRVAAAHPGCAELGRCVDTGTTPGGGSRSVVGWPAPALVNQAGQWALPGGGRLNNERKERAARRGVRGRAWHLAWAGTPHAICVPGCFRMGEAASPWFASAPRPRSFCGWRRRPRTTSRPVPAALRAPSPAW